MTGNDLLRQRLASQRLSISGFTQPAEIVTWLGAIQAQDYAGAKWAVGQRGLGISDAALDRALAEGSILRTHVLRPTWHFVAPEDIRWLLALTAPRVRAASAYQLRALGLEEPLIKQSNDVLHEALSRGSHLTRNELATVLQRAGLATEGLRLVYLIMSAELDQVLCSGARRGKQFTYALLDLRAPQASVLARSEALARLARRYFTSHGPATLQDFVWWSGVTSADAKIGIELAGSTLTPEMLDGQTYRYSPTQPPPKKSSPDIHLLPNYDEYLVGYRDRSAVFDTAHAGKLDARQSVLAQHTIVIDGSVAGTWKRTIVKGSVLLELNPFRPLTPEETAALAAQCVRHAEFLGYPFDIA